MTFIARSITDTTKPKDGKNHIEANFPQDQKINMLKLLKA